MPNFDGNGPLKRGRLIGRGRGPCRIPGSCTQKNTEEKPPNRSGKSEG